MYDKVKNTDYEPYKKTAYEYKNAAGAKMTEVYNKQTASTDTQADVSGQRQGA